MPIHTQHYMIVIGHDCVSTDIDREQCGQLLDFIHDPLLAVLVALPGGVVHAAQKGTAHAVVVGGVSEADQVSACLGYVVFLNTSYAFSTRDFFTAGGTLIGTNRSAE